MTDERPTFRIMDLNESERPQERLEHLEAQSLSNAELIAILLRMAVPGENVCRLDSVCCQPSIDRGSRITFLRLSFDEVQAVGSRDLFHGLRDHLKKYL